VDPPGCTDIDDALHCRSLPNGNFDVGVHIADVSHFIRPGTALDKEAASRATTVYLVDKRIDMVPGKLKILYFKYHYMLHRQFSNINYKMFVFQNYSAQTFVPCEVGRKDSRSPVYGRLILMQI